MKPRPRIAGPVRAWRCDTCRCLTLRAATEPDAPACDRCGGPLEPIALRTKEAP